MQREHTLPNILTIQVVNRNDKKVFKLVREQDDCGRFFKGNAISGGRPIHYSALHAALFMSADSSDVIIVVYDKIDARTYLLKNVELGGHFNDEFRIFPYEENNFGEVTGDAWLSAKDFKVGNVLVIQGYERSITSDPGWLDWRDEKFARK